MKEYYDFDKKKIEEGNKDHFEIYIETEFSICAAHNFKLNKVRTESLASGKSWLFGTLLFSILSCFLLITSVINKNQITWQKKQHQAQVVNPFQPKQ